MDASLTFNGQFNRLMKEAKQNVVNSVHHEIDRVILDLKQSVVKSVDSEFDAQAGHLWKLFMSEFNKLIFNFSKGSQDQSQAVVNFSGMFDTKLLSTQ